MFLGVGFELLRLHPTLSLLSLLHALVVHYMCSHLPVPAACLLLVAMPLLLHHGLLTLWNCKLKLQL